MSTNNKPFDSIKVQDPNSVFGRIISRLRGYTPTQTELETFRSAVRTIVYSTVGTMALVGFSAHRYARSRQWTPFQRFVTATGGSAIGFWVGSSVSSGIVARKVLAVEDSFISTVVREEVARGTKSGSGVAGEQVPEGGYTTKGGTGIVDSEEEATNAPPRRSISPTKKVDVVESVRAYEEFEKEVMNMGVGEDENDSQRRRDTAKPAGQRRYNQYGDVIED